LGTFGKSAPVDEGIEIGCECGIELIFGLEEYFSEK